MPTPDPAASHGAALAARRAQVASLQRQLRPYVTAFTAAVYTDAIPPADADPGAGTPALVAAASSTARLPLTASLTAAAGLGRTRRALRSPVTRAAVRALWYSQVQSFGSTTGAATDAADLITALHDSPLPGKVYEAVRDVYAQARTDGWSPAQVRGVLSYALRADSRASLQSLPATRLIDSTGASRVMPSFTSLARDIELMTEDYTTEKFNAAQVEAIRERGWRSKEWCANYDNRTRDAHLIADGQRVPVDATFTVGGYQMMAPGDTSAPPELTANCRCVIVGHHEDGPAPPGTASNPSPGDLDLDIDLGP